MKSIILGILFFILLLPVDARDIPRYSPEQVMSAVQVYSPDCKLSSCGWDKITLQVVEGEASYSVEYSGKGQWKVEKSCGVNPEQNGTWFYRESTGQMLSSRNYSAE